MGIKRYNLQTMTTPIKGILAFLGLGLIGYSLYRYVTIQKDLISKYTYEIKGLKFKKIQKDVVEADLIVRFSSIADLEVKVKKFYVDFYVNQILVGNFEDMEEFTILANDSVDIPVTLKFNPQLIFTNIIDLSFISFNIKDIAFSVRGFADVSSGFVSATIPVDYSSTFKQIMSE